MTFKIGTDWIDVFKPQPEIKPQPKPEATEQVNEGKVIENNLSGNLLKFKLQTENTIFQLPKLTPDYDVPTTAKKSIFDDGYDGVDTIDENYRSPYFDDTPPKGAAEFLKYDMAFSSPGSKGQAFADTLALHKDDPEWTKNFLREVGKKDVAKYISDSFNNPYLTSKQAERNSANIRAGLELAVKNGDLTQTGMDALVKELKNGNAYAFTEIFGKSSDPQFKQMFVQATINSGSSRLQAAGAYVLKTFSAADQAKFLNGLSDSQLNSFVAGAMAGQFEVRELKSQLDDPYGYNGITNVTVGGIDSLVSIASRETGYNGSVFETAPFSKELQQRIFIAISKGLTNGDAFNNFRDNKIFKDNLSEIFIHHGKEILKAQAPDGAFTDSSFISGMTKFFEMTLFTKNPGGLRDQLMQSVIKTMSDVGDASKAPPLAPEEYEKLHNGWSQQDHVEVMGGLQAMILQAASNQKEYIKNEILNDQAKKQELIGFVTGMAFAFLPGAGDIFGKIAADGASFLKQIPDKIINYTFDQGKSQIESAAKDGLISLLKNMNGSNSAALSDIDAFIGGFKQTVVATSSVLPNGEKGENGKPDELNLRTAFQSAFAFYGDLVRF